MYKQNVNLFKKAVGYASRIAGAALLVGGLASAGYSRAFGEDYNGAMQMLQDPVHKAHFTNSVANAEPRTAEPRQTSKPTSSVDKPQQAPEPQQPAAKSAQKKSKTDYIRQYLRQLHESQRISDWGTNATIMYKPREKDDAGNPVGEEKIAETKYAIVMPNGGRVYISTSEDRSSICTKLEGMRLVCAQVDENASIEQLTAAIEPKISEAETAMRPVKTEYGRR